MLLKAPVLHRIDDLENTSKDRFACTIVLHRIDDLETSHLQLLPQQLVLHRLDDLEIKMISIIGLGFCSSSPR